MLLSIQDEVVNKRLTKAGTNLVISLPFFGYLLFGSGVRVIVDENVQTMSTDGVNVYVGKDFLLKEEISIVMFGLLHELLHIYFSHAGRRGDREKRRWNIAIDIFTNEQCSILLGSIGLHGATVSYKVPDRFIQPQPWAVGKTVEQIYDLLGELSKERPTLIPDLLPGNGEIGDGSDIIPTPTNIDPQESKIWQETFRTDVAHAKALSHRQHASGPVSTAVQSRLDKIMRPTLPWGSLLRGDIVNDLGWDELSYAPPKMKYYPLILPQTLSRKEKTLVLLVDVSASVTQELIRIFQTNVQAAALSATKTVIITFDQIVREKYETTNPYNIFSKVKFMSGAHSFTSAVVAFELAQLVKPSAICCLTDGHIELPGSPVPRTTFVIPEGGKKQPWGRHYIMEHHWR